MYGDVHETRPSQLYLQQNKYLISLTITWSSREIYIISSLKTFFQSSHPCMQGQSLLLALDSDIVTHLVTY